MKDTPGESVFENVDEVLMDKIINHTEKDSDVEDNNEESNETEFSDSDTYSNHSFESKKTSKKYKVLLIGFLGIGLTLLILKNAFHKNCRHKFFWKNKK